VILLLEKSNKCQIAAKESKRKKVELAVKSNTRYIIVVIVKDMIRHYQKKKIRIGFINNLALVIQPVLKVRGAKYFITGVKIKVLEPVL
jgi:hypothetical protein